MPLVKGSNLSTPLRQEVLSQYIHRWTHENATQTYGGKCPACAQRDFRTTNMTQKQWHEYHVALITDEQWLAEHAFHVTRRCKLNLNRRHAEPAYLADSESAGVGA